MDNLSLVLTVTSGPDTDTKTALRPGTCKVISRQINEAVIDRDQTQLRLDDDSGEVLEDDQLNKINQLLAKSSQEPSSPSVQTHPPQNPYKRTQDFILTDANISRAHAMVYNGADSAGIIDLASTNGTFVDGKRIETHAFCGNETITLGETTIQISYNNLSTTRKTHHDH